MILIYYVGRNSQQKQIKKKADKVSINMMNQSVEDIAEDDEYKNTEYVRNLIGHDSFAENQYKKNNEEEVLMLELDPTGSEFVSREDSREPG